MKKFRKINVAIITMLQFGMVAVAVALTLGMTQCRKAPFVTQEPETGETINICFTAGGEAAKTDINCTNGRITWNEGDKIYVVCKNGKLSGTDKVVLLGEYLEVKTDGCLSEISGTVTLPENYTLPAKPIFSFYYVGSQVSFTPQTGGTNLTFNIADQFSASLNDAGEYHIGRADTVKMRYDESLSKYVPVMSKAKTFRSLTSMILLNTEVSGSEFGCPDQKLSMFGDKIRTIMDIDLSDEANPTYTAGTIAFASRTNSQISLLPSNAEGDNTDATIKLTGNNKGAKLTVKNGIKAGRIYVDLVGDDVHPIPAIAQAISLTLTTNSHACTEGRLTGFGGSVTTSTTQTFEYGVVYSKSTVCSDPYIGTAGCSKEIAGNSTTSEKLEFNIDVLTLEAADYVYKTYAIDSEYGFVNYGPIKTVNGSYMPRKCTWANGESPKSFALRAGGSVKFSKGNLQWSARGSHSTVEGTQAGTWRFAEYQYDIRGAENSNISSSYTGWIDLFGYGTSGKNHHPYDASDKNSDYINQDIYGKNYDWGVYNDISNDGYGVGAWRTMKENGFSLDFNEWRYVIRGRGDDSNFGFGKIGGCTNGMIILPDGWSWPSNDLKSKWKSGEKSNWDSNNNYTCVEWTAMENAGAVFLPAAGWRKNTTVNSANSQGYYMSSAVMLPNVYRVYFYNEYLHCSGLESRCYGMGVRLVR